MEVVNDFEIVGDVWIVEKVYKCEAICKECKNKFITNYHALCRMKSCGCARPKKLKPIPEFINGFRTIKCHGYDMNRGVRWATVECKVCKREYEVDPNKLKYRKHCGCMKKDVIACKYAKSHPQLAQTYKHMVARCYNKNNQDYYNYGARGIRICKEWKRDRNIFCEWALNNGFQNKKGLTIDRIDYNKGYNPDNCRWATAIEQGRNTRRNVLTMEIAKKMRNEKGKSQKILAKEYGVSLSTVWLVLNNKVWKEDANTAT